MARKTSQCFRQCDKSAYQRRVGIEAGFFQAAGALRFPVPPGEVFGNPVHLFEIQSECLADVAECALGAIGDDGSGECGALNLPTEWYCERCGAELASL